MTSKKSITVIVGVVVVAVAGLLAVAAMFLVDQGEETAHLYNELRGQRPRNDFVRTAGNSVELRGQWMGMSMANLDAISAQQLGLAEVEQGAAVVAVDAASGARASEAGIQVGDVVVGVDGQPVRNLADLYQRSAKLAADAPVMVDVQRQGQIVTLVVAPPQPDFGVQAALGQQYYCPRDGILIPPGPNGRVPATCPRCNGPLHRYQRGAGFGRGYGPGYGARWRAR